MGSIEDRVTYVNSQSITRPSLRNSEEHLVNVDRAPMFVCSQDSEVAKGIGALQDARPRHSTRADGRCAEGQAQLKVSTSHPDRRV